MRPLLQLVRSGYVCLSPKGKRVINAYVISLITISGLDGLALLLMARLISTETDSAGITEQNQIDSFIPLVSVIVALFIARSAIATLISYIGMKSFAEEEVTRGQQNLLSLQDLPWIMRSRFELSDYYAAVDRGPNALVQGVLISFATLIAEASSAAVILFVMVWVQPVTAITAMAFFSVVAVFQHKLLSVAATRAGIEVNNSFSDIYDLLGDKARFSKILEVMPSQSLDSVLNEKRTHLAKARSKVNFIAALPRYFMESILAIGFVVVSAATYVVSGEDAVIAALVVFAAAGFRLLPIVNRIQGLVLQLFATAPLAREGLSLGSNESLDRNYEEEHLKIGSFAEMEDHVLFQLRDVSYRYPDSSVNVLNNITFSIERGKQYAIVGRSGSGKTTLVDILLGLLDPTDGSFRINRNFEGIARGYVPQESIVFSSGLMENVALEWESGRINLSNAQIAIQKAQLESFGNALESTQKNSNEFKEKTAMSGGQKQRLGLARAFYRNADFIILDESTSALDMSTEHEVMQEVNSMRGNTTTVIVAHRLSTIQNVDQVIYLDHGTIVAMGTFLEVRSQVPEFEKQIQLGVIK